MFVLYIVPITETNNFRERKQISPEGSIIDFSGNKTNLRNQQKKTEYVYVMYLYIQWQKLFWYG